MGTERQEAALGVCPGVLERGWRRADLCMWPICVTRRELSSRNAKTASGGPDTHRGRVRNMLNEQSEESGPGPTLCQLPCADPLV